MKLDQAAFRRAQVYSDSAVVEQRVRRFLPLVRRCAWHIYGMGREALEIDDLMQIGLFALVDCARRHQGAGEDGFAAFAKMRVRGAMLDEIRRIVPGSRGAANRQRAYEDARKVLRQRLHREPGRLDLAEYLSIDSETLAQLEQGRVSLAPLSDVYDDTLPEFADDAPDPFSQLVLDDDRSHIVAALDKLPERSRLVLQLFYAEELNLTEIAQLLEVSVPRVHQLRAQALARLKAAFGDRD